MNKSIQSFAERALATGVPINLGLDIRMLAEQSAGLVTSARNPTDQSDENQPRPDNDVQKNLSAVEIDPHSYSSNTSHEDIPIDQSEHVGLGYSLFLEPFSSGFDAVPRPKTLQSQKPSNMSQSQQQIKNSQQQAHALFNSLPVPRSYAYRETSFARRLQRSCMEAGVR
jgi:hypothetical protein